MEIAGIIRLYTDLANQQRKRLGLNEFANMQRVFDEICGNMDYLRVAQWGDVGNIKTQSQLDPEKQKLLAKIGKVQKFLMNLRLELEEMEMIELHGPKDNA